MWSWLILWMVAETCQAFNMDPATSSIYSMHESGNAYFGYSIAIRPQASKHFNTSWVVQVGAPKLSIKGINAKEPGGMFRCTTAGHCSLSPLDVAGNIMINTRKAGQLFREKKDDAWLGVAMDLRDTAQGELSVVCGHRLGYQTEGNPLGVSQDHYLLVGACYVENLSSPGNITKLLPLRDEGRAYFLYSSTHADYDWGLGLAGMSAKLGDAGGLLLGAPTVYHMTGTVVAYPNNLRHPSVPKLKLVNDIKTDTYAYFGYSVGRGRFFGDGVEWLTMGAPRSADLHGRVFPFLIQGLGEDVRIKLHRAILKGKTYGEYFGAALAVADVNGDTYDDLLVGAPMFSRRSVDQGRVYVFMGQKQGFDDGPVYDGTAAGGRFGTCLSSLGDIDQDGYQDIAVGAPYENSRGAVYVYRGGPRGLRLSPSQKIYASDISPLLRGFGISISSGVDVDGDHFPEVGVGAYLSGHAVVMRTRPVVTLSLDIQHPKFVDRNQAAFNVTFCVSYFGKHPPQEISVTGVGVVDENMNRGTFAKSGSAWLSMDLNITIIKPLCSTYSVRLSKTRQNGTFEKPITMTLEAQLLAPPSYVPKSGWAPLNPVLSTDAPRAKKDVEIPFSGECGQDDECVSKLELKCSIRQRGRSVSLRLGTDDTVEISFSVRNTGEPAKLTRLLISLTGGITPEFRKKDISCSPKSDNNIICELDTLPESAERTLTLELSAESSNRASSSLLTVAAALLTDSKDDSKDRSCRLDVDLVSDAKMALKTSAPSTIHLTSQLSTINFTHSYDVDKIGTSPVTGTVLMVSIPISISGVTFSALMASPATIASEQDDEGLMDSLDTSLSAASEVGSLTVGRETVLNQSDIASAQPNTQPNIPKKVDEESAELQPKTNSSDYSVLFINCSCYQVVCQTVTVHSASPTFTHQFAILLNLSALEPFLKNKKLIHFETNGTLTAQDGFGVACDSKATASTSIAITTLAASVDMKIILLSALAGGFVYAIIFSALLKEGFFRRKTKEQIEALKAEDFIKERFSLYEGESPRKSSEGAISYKTIAPDYDNTY